ncbi:MAG: FAD-binding protein, partial [Acidimicrobiia bacterium]
MTTWSNWVGNQTFAPRQVVATADEESVQEQVRAAVAGSYRVRTFGTGHSFTPIVETDVLLDTTALRGIVEIDEPARR